MAELDVISEKIYNENKSNPIMDFLKNVFSVTPIDTTRQKQTKLSVYKGGAEKTPTGLNNALNLPKDSLLKFATKYNLPTTSNKDFQQASLDLLSKMPGGKSKVNEIVSTYGTPKAGKLADNLLGVRTLSMMKALDDVSAQNQQEQSRLSAIASRFILTPEGGYSYGQNREGFANYLNTGKLDTTQALKISNEDMGKLQKLFPKKFK